MAGIFHNVHLHTKCAVLKKFVQFKRKKCNSQGRYAVTQGCTTVNSSKNGRFRHEQIGEAQPLVVAFILSCQKQAVQSHLQPKEHSIAGFYVQFQIFL